MMRSNHRRDSRARPARQSLRFSLAALAFSRIVRHWNLRRAGRGRRYRCTGAVIAGTLAGWSCNASNPPLEFDGSYDLARLPVGHSYLLYAEPLSGLAGPGRTSALHSMEPVQARMLFAPPCGHHSRC